MPIVHLNSVSELQAILGKSKDKLSVIDFHASWCGPCHAIAPTFEALSKKYTNVNFLKCDTEAATDVASLYSIAALPTFVFLKGKNKVDQVQGANKAGLENALRRHSETSTSFSGKGQALGGSNSTGGTLEKPTFGLDKLDPQVQILLGLIAMYFLFWCIS